MSKHLQGPKNRLIPQSVNYTYSIIAICTCRLFVLCGWDTRGGGDGRFGGRKAQLWITNVLNIYMGMFTSGSRLMHLVLIYSFLHHGISFTHHMNIFIEFYQNKVFRSQKFCRDTLTCCLHKQLSRFQKGTADVLHQNLDPQPISHYCDIQ